MFLISLFSHQNLDLFGSLEVEMSKNITLSKAFGNWCEQTSFLKIISLYKYLFKERENIFLGDLAALVISALR